MIVGLLGAVLGLWGASLAVRGLAARIDALASRLARLGTRSRTMGRAASIIGTVAGLVLLPAGCILGLLAANYNPGSDLLDALPSLWTSIALVCGFASLALIFVGFQFDPARGRARCPACWYSMQGFESHTCPECGRAPGPPALLLKTRRSPPVIAFGVALLLASLALSRVAAVRAMGWKGAFPTTVLILGLEHLPDSLISPTGSASPAIWTGTLAYRADNTVMPTWQEEWLRRRATDLYRHASGPDDMLRALTLGGMCGGTDTGSCERLRAWIARDLASPDPAINTRALQLAQGLSWVFDPVQTQRNVDWLLGLLASPDAPVRTGALSLLPHFSTAGLLLTPPLVQRTRDRSLTEDQRVFAATALLLSPRDQFALRPPRTDALGEIWRDDPTTRRCLLRGITQAAGRQPGGWNSLLTELAFDMHLVIDLLTDADPDASRAGAALVNCRVMKNGTWDQTLIDAVLPRLEQERPEAKTILSTLAAANHPGPLPPPILTALLALASGKDADLAGSARELLYVTHTIARPTGDQTPAPPGGP